MRVCVSMMPVFLRRLITCVFSEHSGRGFHCYSSSSVPPAAPKLILILNACSCSRSGRAGDCLLFPPSGHLQLHLIQMPICSLQIGSCWSRLPGQPVCLGILRPCSTKVHMRVCTRKIPYRRGFTLGLLSLVHR